MRVGVGHLAAHDVPQQRRQLAVELKELQAGGQAGQAGNDGKGAQAGRASVSREDS